MRNHDDFRQLVDHAITRDDLVGIRPVVEKELLHYEILNTLHKSGALKHLVFQGGTSLRLCYGSQRYSEDLDFAGGPDFANAHMSHLRDMLEKNVASRYGLEVTVKAPKQVREEPSRDGVQVDAWQVAIQTAPDRRDVPKQKIKIEVANVTPHTREVRPIKNNWVEAASGFDDLLIGVETMEEIMADKLVALPAVQSHVRNRDIWDLTFLAQRRKKPAISMVSAKVTEYRVDEYDAKLADMIERLPDIVEGNNFNQEMQRFLPPALVRSRLNNPEFREYMRKTVGDLLEEVRRGLDPDHVDINDDPFTI
ncbi:nucleotidyl transferase AbiEii/AbiGii toxin family protein [Sulfitobacter sp. R18_1]|uniref:nucleotidyl transferase AbiEii/AbiGii toxin family protein n=1 Tax=Sulfitobacter sp. R18_1 TaxID=2821104 RepID=UPI001ADB3EB2|nr:nucleotidyl transferase AbiEii/AbiGii toxin family protein [Sulfitobacter sp. R18_1]MBO9428703.1 nucleotidyl transferase AbiEii/AbiGii toxin family protein [Sulfitobacter sp. R18_1]